MNTHFAEPYRLSGEFGPAQSCQETGEEERAQPLGNIAFGGDAPGINRRLGVLTAKTVRGE